MANAIKNYEWWHDAVFGHKPTRDAIPPEVLRAYLDAIHMGARENRGIKGSPYNPVTGTL